MSLDQVSVSGQLQTAGTAWLAAGAVRHGHFAFSVLCCRLVEMGYETASLYLSTFAMSNSTECDVCLSFPT